MEALVGIKTQQLLDINIKNPKFTKNSITNSQSMYLCGFMLGINGSQSWPSTDEAVACGDPYHAWCDRSRDDFAYTRRNRAKARHG